MPATNVEAWAAKFEKNCLRDAAAITGLEAAGWRVLVIWECETRNEADLSIRLTLAVK